MLHRMRPLARSAIVAALLLVVALMLVACGDTGPKTSGTSPSDGSTEKTTDLVLATTTSTQDSGLLDVLVPAFEKANPKYKVRVVAVGSGQALAMGEKKDADVLLVHSKKSEEEFMTKGFGDERKQVFYNDFVIVGPADDPAGIKASGKAVDAFKKIAAAGKTDAAATQFISRGDDSGTFKKEQSIWETASVEPTAPGQSWYVSAGQGMGEVLTLSSEKKAYTLSDRATYLTMKDQLQLDLLVEGDKQLFNQYSVITIPGAKNVEGGKAFFDWVSGPEGQKVVGEFGTEKYGRQLFVPNAE